MKSLTLTLNNEGGTDIGIIRLDDPGYSLRVVVPIGTSFHHESTFLHTDHPDKDGKEQDIQASKSYSVMEDLVFEFQIHLPGAFSLQLHNQSQSGPIVRFIVDPIVTINKKKVPTNGLVIQTNYGRCIGNVQDWVKNLTPIAELGYNMIHIPPFQELGHHSHFSIKDQLQVSKFLFPQNIDAKQRWPLLIKVIKEIEEKLNIVFMTDIVLNHTNQDSEWLQVHPEAGYNEENTPHLRPAIYIDNILNEVSLEIAQGKVKNLPPDLPASKRNELSDYIRNKLINSDLRKFFTIDEDTAVKALKDAENVTLPKHIEMLRMRAVNYGAPQRLNVLRTRGIINDGSFQMGSVRIDNDYAIALFRPPGEFKEERLNEFRFALKTINAPMTQHFEAIVNDVVSAVVNSFCYNRYDPNGPKLGPITAAVPIAWRYFSPVVCFKGTPKERVYHLANNGWIFGAKPTEDFIGPHSEAYLRRQVVIWGDCVKLRYGSCPEDNPWLWDYMKQYVESVARVVHGLRLDNAHSTPLPVAEYFIKCARAINPDLYIMAELFTGGEDEDIHYINHIGINSVLREAFHHLGASDLTHLLWLSGGRPVAALDSLDQDSYVRPLRQIPGVIFDLTHDNEVPYFDRLSAACAVSMASSPVASTRGYDDYLPFNPSVVEEFRQYPLSKDMPGIQKVRSIINHMHAKMAVDGLDELMSHYHGNVVSLFRCNSATGEGIWMVVRLGDGDWIGELDCVAPIADLVFEARCIEVQTSDCSKNIVPSKCKLFLNEDMKKLSSCSIRDGTHLVLNNFPVGSVVCFRTNLPSSMLSTIKSLEVKVIAEALNKLTASLSFTDLCVLMFRCAAEEHASIGNGPYVFPGYGECFYAGTQGVITAFDWRKDMGSPVFQNVRDGDWLSNFMCKRLFQVPHLIPVQRLMGIMCHKITHLQRFLIPKYFDRLIRALDISGREQIKRNMSAFVRDGDDFVHALAFSSVAFYSPVRDAPLVHESLISIYKKTLINRFDCCLAAGLPHFAAGYMRSWGRDTMIALRGIFLTTGRFAEARDHLIAFASCLRHGLIPNLHDACLNPRYNARDATWFFLQALQDYQKMAPPGENIFKWVVPRLFPTDDQREHERKYAGKPTRPLVEMADIVLEILTKHANGIHFVEWNAGTRIDSVMRENGFHIDIVTDWSNGFVLGGNADNCGTWMDKMGSSEKAGNFGLPSTPRDGAAIEIIGLLASTLRWLDEQVKCGNFPHKGVQLTAQQKTVTWGEWHSLIVANFESWFYVPLHKADDGRYFIEASLVGQRGIYKDTVGASNEFGDYQLRPNICIAMTVAPELFDPSHAIRCLNIVEEQLCGKIGMKTLTPNDWRYRPYYINSDDSEDFLVSKGANYHNGPEWVWPAGYFFRASMVHGRGITERMRKMLASIKSALINSWAVGLPELTQLDGQQCNDSCPTQAWSVAAILDTLYDHRGYSREEVAAWTADVADESSDSQQ